MRPSSARIIARLAEGGTERNALGRSRGGFSTKINARTNAEGLPIGVVITPGQAHDVTAFPALMQEIERDPEQMLGDSGYDSEAVRNEIEERGGEAAIPSTANRKYSMSSTRLFMLCAIASNASSIERRTHPASPPATTN